MSVVDIAQQLIGIDTSGPPAEELPLAEWIAAFLTARGFEVRLQEVGPRRANVIAKIGEGAGPGLLLSGHMDEVLVGDLAAWTVTQPFTPVIRDGKLYGRGACDMKGGIACLLQAADQLHRQRFERQLTLVFTAGEDTGGWFVSRVLSEGLVTPAEARGGVVAEATMLEIVRCHKAIGGADVAFTGRAVHSSVPEQGINAILQSVAFLNELGRLQERLRAAVHPLLGHSVITPVMIDGGIKHNIIPDRCDLALDARLLPDHGTAEMLSSWLQELIAVLAARDTSFKAGIEGLVVKPALEVPADATIVRILEELCGTAPTGAPYYTEAVDYSLAGIPTVVCGPGSIDQAHGANEFISLEQLEKGVGLFNRLIAKVCL